MIVGIAAIMISLSPHLWGASSSVASSSPEEIRLWPADAPGALGNNHGDIPTLTPYRPEPGKRNGASMVVLPGGGFVHLAPAEGKPYAEWLASHGITAYVLKYRLTSDHYNYPTPLVDGLRAMRM